jgi:hypothetical protein
MKVDRQDIKYFISNVKSNWPNCSDEEFVEHLCHYMEVNPGCIDVNGVSKKGRYTYSTVGYGVFSLFGERYRMGRIEVFDREDESGYQIHEGGYSMPFEAASQFEDFIESLQTDLPINIDIGSYEWCERECANDLGFDNVDDMRDKEKIKEYNKKKNDAYAVKQGYKDWDDLVVNSKFGDKKL